MAKPKRHSYQEVRKRVNRKCIFCDETDYDLLDVHRIQPGADGGKYNAHNTVVACCRCHRLIHAGSITIDRKYPTSRGIPMLHFWEDGVEKWVYEETRHSS